jgi:hypothetical protein
VKTEMKEYHGTLIITSLDGKCQVDVDIETGEIIAGEFPEVTVNEMYRFIHAVKSRYSRFLTSKAMDKYTD